MGHDDAIDGAVVGGAPDARGKLKHPFRVHVGSGKATEIVDDHATDVVEPGRSLEDLLARQRRNREAAAGIERAGDGAAGEHREQRRQVVGCRQGRLNPSARRRSASCRYGTCSRCRSESRQRSRPCRGRRAPAGEGSPPAWLRFPARRRSPRRRPGARRRPLILRSFFHLSRSADQLIFPVNEVTWF